MSDAQSRNPGWQDDVRRKTVKLGYWTLAWLLSMAIANFGPKFLWQSHELITMTAIIVNLLIGIGMIVANKDHLRSLDEMQQRIHLEAMGLALGVSLVAGLAYSNLDVLNIISFDAEISHVVILVGLTYLAALVVLNRKFR